MDCRKNSSSWSGKTIIMRVIIVKLWLKKVSNHQDLMNVLLNKVIPSYSILMIADCYINISFKLKNIHQVNYQNNIYTMSLISI